MPVNDSATTLPALVVNSSTDRTPIFSDEETPRNNSPCLTTPLRPCPIQSPRMQSNEPDLSDSGPEDTDLNLGDVPEEEKTEATSWWRRIPRWLRMLVLKISLVLILILPGVIDRHLYKDDGHVLEFNLYFWYFTKDD